MKFSEKYKDKFLHAAVGIMSYAILHLWLWSEPSLLIIAVVARLKEVYDKRHPDAHTSDGWDAYWTIIPAIVVANLELLLCVYFTG